MKRLTAVVMCMCTWVLGACAVVRSPQVQPGALGEGLTYFLPKREVKVSAERTLLKKDELQRAIAVKKGELAPATALQTEAVARVRTARARLGTVPIQRDSGAKALIDRDLTLALADSTIATAKKGAIELELREAEANLAILENAPKASCTFTYSATVELLPPVADTRRRFVANVAHRVQRDDDVKLAVNGAGLLSSAKMTAQDRTGDILVDLAGAVAGVRVGMASPSTAPLLRPPTADTVGCAQLPTKFAYRLDPAEPKEVQQLNTQLESSGFPFRLEVPAVVSGAQPQDSTAKLVAARADSEARADFERQLADAARRGALFYRSSVPQTIVLRQCDGGPECSVTKGSTPVDAAVTTLPQLGPISYIPMHSSLFVKTVDDVVFENGVVTSWNAIRPSEVAEVVRLPVRILKSAVSVPAELVKLRIDLADQEKGLAASQKAQIEANARLAAIQACVNAAGSDRDATLACFKQE